MIPSRKPQTIFALFVKSNFVHVFSAAARLLTAFVLLLAMSGCSSTKQTWRDWSDAHGSATPNLAEPVISPTPAFHTNALVLAPRYRMGDGARVAPGFDLKMRNPDFPRTYIETIYIDLSCPTNGVHITWAGSKASDGPVGPWRLTPGRGTTGVDCDDMEDSNTVNSLCTPKGAFPVAGFADHLEQTPVCRYATWVLHAPRYVAIHSHTELPTVPASAGCIRVPYETAKLIHNNSLAGVTIVNISGTWQRPATREDRVIANAAPSFVR
jgi:hypothetical protein